MADLNSFLHNWFCFATKEVKTVLSMPEVGKINNISKIRSVSHNTPTWQGGIPEHDDGIGVHRFCASDEMLQDYDTRTCTLKSVQPTETVHTLLTKATCK